MATVIGRNEWTGHRLKTRAEKAWADYVQGIQGMLPYNEAIKLFNATREPHYRRWKEIEAARSRIIHRELNESDISGA